MFKKLMERVVICFLFVLLFLVGVSAQNDDWDSYGNDSDDAGDPDNNSDTDSGDSSSTSNPGDNSGASSGSGDSPDSVQYTSNFYLALGVLGVGILIIIFFAYLFLKTPRSDWPK
jgi:hypothetical protein